MKQISTKHLMYCPMTGLGLYGGHRGARWLKNRVKIFSQFVLPSLVAQTNRDFILWVSARYQDKNDKNLLEMKRIIESAGVRCVFTYAGVCFWDDKYSDEEAHTRLVAAIHGSMGALLNEIGEADEILMTIQPSDDCYRSTAVQEIQDFFRDNLTYNVFGYQMGYVCDYISGRLAEWNPKTTPPFYTIRFPREKFIDPLQHIKYTGPYKSHEYVKDYLAAKYVDERGFLVGTHQDNISTVFDHPYAVHEFLGDNITPILRDFWPNGVGKLELPFSPGRFVFTRLPYSWKRKLRYLAGEKKTVFRPLFTFIYNVLRS